MKSILLQPSVRFMAVDQIVGLYEKKMGDAMKYRKPSGNVVDEFLAIKLELCVGSNRGEDSTGDSACCDIVEPRRRNNAFERDHT